MAEDSEDAPRAPRGTESSAEKKSTGGNIVTRKLGPLPVWAWVVIGAGGLLFLRSRRGASASSAAPAIGPTSAVTGGGLPSGGYTGGADNVGLASLIQQMQGQLAAIQTPAPTSSAFDPSGFISGYAGKDGPISLGQAYAAIDDAFQQSLGRAPVESPTIDAMAKQIVAQQSYVPTLQGIVYSTEGVNRYAGSQTSTTLASHQMYPFTSPQAPVSGTNPFPIGA